MKINSIIERMIIDRVTLQKLPSVELLKLYQSDDLTMAIFRAVENEIIMRLG